LFREFQAHSWEAVPGAETVEDLANRARNAWDRLIREAGFTNLRPKHPLYQIKSISFRGIMEFIRSQELQTEYGNIFNFLFQLIRSIPLKFAPATNEIWNMDHAAAIAGMMNKNFVKAICEAYKKLIIDCAADIVVDFWNPFACIAARRLKKPLITVIQSDQHPDNKGLIWWKKPPKNLPSALPVVNQIMSGFGLGEITKMEELNIGDLTLVVGIPETDPVPVDNNCIHIGPILWENSDVRLPEWINKISNEKPLIWVYSGNPRYRRKRTVVDSEIIIQAAVQVLAEEDVTVILTTGHHELPEELLPLPDNFYFAKYLPGLRLAEICDLMIHHGGYGSCQTGLYTGTPAVIIPTFSERESNARRIAALSAGEFVLPVLNAVNEKAVDLNEFRAKVKMVLATPSYLKNAKKYSKLLKTFGGPQKAAQKIKGFADDVMARRQNKLSFLPGR